MSSQYEQVNESILVEITIDKMLGVISFTEPKEGGRKLTIEEIRQAIKDKGITQGIMEAELEEIYNNHQYNYKYIIAKGKQPVEGQDGFIQFNFDVDSLKQFKPKVNDDGTVDLKDLSAVRNVRKGEVLAVKVPAKQGEAGYNVLGQVIRPKMAREARIPKGKNTAILDDNLTLVADIDGKLEYDEHNIYINSVFTIEGDLDSSIGNVDFVGSVVVQGNIHSGFSIKAGGSVEVRGSVDDAIIIAGEDIILTYGIQGTEKSKLVAKGNVIAKFIQNANVEAGGNVITEAILHSTVTAGDSIKVDMGKGTIVGGSVAATNMIVARGIGSLMGTVTAIEIGIPPSIYTEHKQLKEALKNKRDELNKVDQSISFLMSKHRENPLNPQRKAMLENLTATRRAVAEEYETLNARTTRIGETLNNVREGLIKCSDVIYPGVKITYGNLVKYISDKQLSATIYKKDGEIYIGN